MHATAERIRSNQLPVRNRHNDPIGSNVQHGRYNMEDSCRLKSI